MTCDTGVHGSPEPGDWVAELPGKEASDYWRVQNGWDNPLNFALFGLARQGHMPEWVHTNWDLPILDLGPGNKHINGAIRLEYPTFNFESPEYNPPATRRSNGVITMYPGDSEKPLDYTGTQYFDRASEWRCCLPFEDGTVGGIYAVNILEHLWDPRPIMAECARVLAPGCPLNIVVPHGSHGIYLQDIDHKKPFILDSWKNWLQNGYWGPDRSDLKLRIGANFKFGIKEENVNIMTQLIKEA